MDIDFKQITYDEYYDDYVATKKLDSGIMVKVTFQESRSWPNGSWLSYNVSLCIYRKRKEFHNDNYTIMDPQHKTGLEGLVFARNAISNFEDYIAERFPDVPIKIKMFWGDKRRRDIYIRYMTKYGYRIDRDRDGSKILAKYLNKGD